MRPRVRAARFAHFFVDNLGFRVFCRETRKGFLNKIYHPNVDEHSGSVCLDVINQTWSPMFDLVNVFEVFLPQLLLYPNPTDPLNGEAAALLLKQEERYKQKVAEYVRRYATEEAAHAAIAPGDDVNDATATAAAVDDDDQVSLDGDDPNATDPMASFDDL